MHRLALRNVYINISIHITVIHGYKTPVLNMPTSHSHLPSNQMSVNMLQMQQRELMAMRKAIKETRGRRLIIMATCITIKNNKPEIRVQ